ALSAAFYCLGVRRLWQKAGTGRVVSARQVAAFAVGIVALAIALVSPLEALSGVLFSAHMVQHLLLILVAAPLMALGAQPAIWLWALPRRRRRPLARWWRRQQPLHIAWRALSAPFAVWLLHTGAVWIWHVPALYEAALASEAIHTLEHLTFFGTALLFWWVLLGRTTQGATRYLTGMALAAGTAFHGSLLGVLMTFAPAPWYASYAATAAPWGLTPLEDQQLAGVIMWVPAGTVYVVVLLALLGVWLRTLEEQDRMSGHAPARQGTG
ncbi:MAG TPA: cytochrome c oxidase assembly protein, partial [Caldilineaceae bacterium]|nr:cytochrome c oxidase assembly protein [Caldilineaceae bacterium]